jgi:molybdopterin molybdotransferase
MITVAEAKARILDTIIPLDRENIALTKAYGRILATPLYAQINMPPFASSMMDGFAFAFIDKTKAYETGLCVLPKTSAAGGALSERTSLPSGYCQRIFTGAPLPDGADCVIPQECVLITPPQDNGLQHIRFNADWRAEPGCYVRPCGLDFTTGTLLLPAGKHLNSRDIALAGAADYATLSVYRSPRLGLLATGDELYMPGGGGTEQNGQIPASSYAALAALAKAAGAELIRGPLIADRLEALEASLHELLRQNVDVIVTTGGASVGDHDIIRQFFAKAQIKSSPSPLPVAPGQESVLLRPAIWKVALRPGKPLLFGHYHGRPWLGLPGNPVSALITALLFLRPLLWQLQGAQPYLSLPLLPAFLSHPLPDNDGREDYLRAQINMSCDQLTRYVTALPQQDSSRLWQLAKANALLVRPPHDPAKAAGDKVMIIPLEGLL